MRYSRKHIPSGTVDIESFNTTHSEVFQYNDKASVLRQYRTAIQLIDCWNKQQPKTWFYTLLGEHE